MIHSIGNDKLVIKVDDCGAVFTSIFDVGSKRELLYQVNPNVWGSQDIAIFPVIDHAPYFIDGKKYFCDMKHGIIRGMQSNVISKTSNSLSLRFDSTPNTLRQFPFEFSFTATFEVANKRINVTYSVENKSDRPMPFYVGGHPGLYAKNGIADVCFGSLEKPTIWLIENGFVAGKKNFGEIDSVHVSKEVLLVYKTFILSGIKTNSYLMKTDDVDYLIETDAPVIGLWSKSFAGEYVCFEPWWGMAIQKADTRDLSKKEFVNIIEDSASFKYSIEPAIH